VVEVLEDTEEAELDEGEDGLELGLLKQVILILQSVPVQVPTGQGTRQGGSHLPVFLFTT
jgi:hypothetical protein